MKRQLRKLDDWHDASMVGGRPVGKVMSISQLFLGAKEESLPSGGDLNVESRRPPSPPFTPNPNPPYPAEASLPLERSLARLRTQYAAVAKKDRHADIDWWSLLNRRDLSSLYTTALSIQVASCRPLSPFLIRIEAASGEGAMNQSPVERGEENDRGIIWLNLGWLCREAQQGRPLRLVHPSLSGLTKGDVIVERILSLLSTASHRLVLFDATHLGTCSLVAKRFIVEESS